MHFERIDKTVVEAEFIEVLPNIYQGLVMEKRVSQASVNLYIIKDKYSCLFVDCGYDSEYSNRVLQSGIKQLNIDSTKARLVITHAHQDHFGGAIWCMNQGMQIFISKQEFEHLLVGDYFPLSVAIMAGISATEYSSIYDKGAKLAENNRFKPLALHCKFLDSGDTLAVADYNLEVITYKGHSREQVCLLDKRHKIMFSADQVVTGSPSVNISSCNYGALYKYLTDIRSIRCMGLDYLLPGHGQLLARKDATLELAIANIESSYYRLLDSVVNIIADIGRTGCSAIEIVSYMYHKDCDSYFLHITRGKIVMTNKVLACLEYLYESGRISRIDKNGSFIYSN